MRKPMIKITDNSVHGWLDDADTSLIQLCNLIDINDEIVAELWWSGVPNVKNISLKTKKALMTYIYDGEYLIPSSATTKDFDGALQGIPINNDLPLNMIVTSPEINWSQTTKNATLTLEDGNLVTCDALVKRANENTWQVMLKADALTKISSL